MYSFTSVLFLSVSCCIDRDFVFEMNCGDEKPQVSVIVRAEYARSARCYLKLKKFTVDNIIACFRLRGLQLSLLFLFQQKAIPRVQFEKGK